MANFVTTNLLDSESARLEALINSEGQRARAAEAQLLYLINSEGIIISDLSVKLADKQGKLTAGTNITITSEGIISAKGGDGKVKDVLVDNVSVLDSEGKAYIELQPLDDKISDEAARAVDAENGLQNEINNLDALLNSEGIRVDTLETGLIDLALEVSTKQNKLTAGDNIEFNSEGTVISVSKAIPTFNFDRETRTLYITSRI